MVERAAFVGVGALGQALLERLLLADVPTSAYDVSEISMNAARELGAGEAASAAAAARDADYVHICVRTDDEVLEACIGTEGALHAMSPGSLLIVHSTVFPETTHRVAEEAAPRRVRVIDAAVVGVPAAVRAGDACFLLGGAEDDVRDASVHLKPLGRAAYHFGPLGAGNVAKIAKNLATAIDRIAMTEVVSLAEAGGLDATQFLDMMRVEFESLTRNWERAFAIEGGRAIAKPATNLLNKDVHHAAAYAQEHGLDVPVTRSAAESAKKMVAAWSRR